MVGQEDRWNERGMEDGNSLKERIYDYRVK